MFLRFFWDWFIFFSRFLVVSVLCCHFLFSTFFYFFFSPAPLNLKERLCFSRKKFSLKNVLLFKSSAVPKEACQLFRVRLDFSLSHTLVYNAKFKQNLRPISVLHDATSNVILYSNKGEINLFRFPLQITESLLLY